jgi:hypothetical protein
MNQYIKYFNTKLIEKRELTKILVNYTPEKDNIKMMNFINNKNQN